MTVCIVLNVLSAGLQSMSLVGLSLMVAYMYFLKRDVEIQQVVTYERQINRGIGNTMNESRYLKTS